MSVGTGRTIRAGNGRKFTLAELLKSGGAGSVYRVREDGELVAKIYHDYVDSGLYQRKVSAMLSLSPELPDLMDKTGRYVQIAWPTDLLYAERSRFVGFLMPAVDVKATSELECILQERQARMLGLPTGLGAKITLAANLAAVIAELHRQHHRVVDLKPVNLRFYPQSLYMAMLDCDGFSIQGEDERFPAPQYTPEYMAPEFHANGITVPGEEQQDRFALAVIVFQLLNFGIHPFTGRPASERVPTDIPARIAGRFHAYGLRPNAHLRPSMVSGHLAMPMELRQLFDRAFDGPGLSRPTALEWASALRGYAQRSNLRLASCRSDGEHQHFAGLPCAACTRAELIAQTAQKQRAAKNAAATAAGATLHAARMRPTPTHLRTMPNAVPTAAPRAKKGQQKRWQRPPPPPLRPLPRFRAMPTSTWQLKLVPAILLLIFFGYLAFKDNPPPPAPTYSATPPARAQEVSPTWKTDFPSVADGVVPIASSNDVPRHMWPDMWMQLRDARRQALAVASATTAGNDLEFQRGLNRLMRLREHEFSADAYAREEAGARFQTFMHSARHANARIRAAHMADLHAYLQRNPYDAQAACEWGWLALMDGKREFAEDAFVRAIWADPVFAGGWYGLGATASDHEVRIGALAMSQKLHSYSEVDALALEDFITFALDLAGMESSEWRITTKHATDVAEGKAR